MGNTQNSDFVDRQRAEQIMTNYRLLDKLPDLRFGDATLIQDQKTKEEYLLKELLTASEDDFLKCQRELDKKTGFRHPNLVQLIGYTTKQQSNFCAKSFKIFAVYEYCNWNLSKDIKSRVNQTDYRNPYSELELWQISFDLIEALSYLQQIRVVHGDIRPETILQTKGAKFTKISDQSLFKKSDAFLEIMSNSDFQTNEVYLSPAQIKALETNSFPPVHNVYKTDVFSLGVSILSAACLLTMDDAYNYHSYYINGNYLDSYINSLQHQYSHNFCELLRKMLKIDETQRPDFIQLSEYIRQNTFNYNRYLSTHNFNKANEKGVKCVVNDDEIDNMKSSIYEPQEYGQKNDHLSSPILKKNQQRDSTFRTYVMHGHDQYLQSDFGRIDDTFEVQAPLKELVTESRITRNKQTKLTHDNYLECNIYFQKKEMKHNSDQISFLLKKYSSDNHQNTFTQPQKTNSPQISVYNPNKTLDITGCIKKETAMQSSLTPHKLHLESQVFSNSQNNVSNKIRVLESFQNGSRYEGEKAQNMRNGQGCFYYADGGMYSGEWLDNKMHGFGILYYSSGKPAYQGQWANDKFQGKGVLYNENPNVLEGSFDYSNFHYLNDQWTKYEGYFNIDNREGHGVLTLQNGEWIEGEFSSDQLNGQCMFHSRTGQIIAGKWRNNVLISTSS